MKKLTQAELDQIYTKHLRFLNGEGDELRADISLMDVKGLDFSRKKWEYAHMSCADMSYTNMYNADMRNVDMSYTDMYNANMSYANMSYANMYSAKMSYAKMSYANMYHANMSHANMYNAKMLNSNLCATNLSGVTGLPSQKTFISQFSRISDGIIVYKGISNTSYPPNPNWKIEPGQFLEEVVNPTRQSLCGCGVNFGTVEYIRLHYPEAVIWKCLIHNEDLTDVVVPYSTDGKARCGRLQLLNIL